MGLNTLAPSKRSPFVLNIIEPLLASVTGATVMPTSPEGQLPNATLVPWVLLHILNPTWHGSQGGVPVQHSPLARRCSGLEYDSNCVSSVYVARAVVTYRNEWVHRHNALFLLYARYRGTYCKYREQEKMHRRASKKKTRIVAVSETLTKKSRSGPYKTR